MASCRLRYALQWGECSVLALFGLNKNLKKLSQTGLCKLLIKHIELVPSRVNQKSLEDNTQLFLLTSQSANIDIAVTKLNIVSFSVHRRIKIISK